MKRVLWLVFVIAACTSTPEQTPPGPTADGRNPTLPPAPTFATPQDTIELDNVRSVTYLGRLDQPGVRSTLFAHALSPDGTRLAALSNDLLLGWDLNTGEVIYTTSRSNAIDLYYAFDKSEIYVIHANGQVHIHDAERGREQNTFSGHVRFSGASAYYGEGDLLALGGDDGTVKVWDTFERVSLVTINAHAIRITRVAFSADGTLLATADEAGIVRVWDWQAREMVAEFDHQGAPVGLITFSPDGTHLAAATLGYTGLWSITDNEFALSLPTGTGGASEILLYSPDGRYLVTGGRTENAIVWDVVAGEVAAVLPGMGGDRMSAVFSPDGSLLLMSLLSGPVTLWDMTRITEETVQRADLSVETNTVLTVDWSDDGFVITLIDALGPVYVWGIGVEGE